MGMHHEYSPSKYPAWNECVHFRSTDRGSDEASEGTLAHKQLAEAVDRGVEPEHPSALWAYNELLARAERTTVHSEVYLEDEETGVFGTADLIWQDSDGIVNIADFKTFGDGTKNYFPQLMGYAALLYAIRNKCSLFGVHIDLRCRLLVLNGGNHTVDSMDATFSACSIYLKNLLAKVKGGEGEYKLNPFCQYCNKIKECPMCDKAIATVNNEVQFSKMSRPQQLVILDAVDKIAKAIREEAKAECLANGGVLEADGIRYEMKPWAGKAVLKDICELASDIKAPVLTNKKGEAVEAEGLAPDELIKLCDVGKTKLVSALAEKNCGNKAVKKVDITAWVDAHFVKTEGAPHFVRTM